MGTSVKDVTGVINTGQSQVNNSSRPILLLRSTSLPTSEFLDRLTSGKINVGPNKVQSEVNACEKENKPSNEKSETDNLCTCKPENDKEEIKSATENVEDPQQASCQQKTATIRLHYYPEGGWGWVICGCAMLVEIVAQGLHMAYGAFYVEILLNYGEQKQLQASCLGSLSMAVSLFACPIVVAICRRNSTRLTAVIGGLVSALGCLFTSFASQFHQLYFSYGVVLGLGVVLCRCPANLMIGQYFKRKRELVEAIVHGCSGVGLILQSIAYAQTIRSKGWRFGLQILTIVIFTTFFAGIFYRSASLYHPQRRAILHLKTQKRKIKDKKTRFDDKVPFFDFTTLRSRTVQILLLSSAMTSLGSSSPLVFLIHEAQLNGIDASSMVLLQTFLGLSILLGSLSFGAVIVRDSSECRIARHYLCQAAGLMVSLSFLAMTAVDEYHGYVFFVWIYGLFYGGYNYSLKMVTYEKVRARNFSRTWSFIQWSQAIPTAVGIPLTGLINFKLGNKMGYYFCAGSTFIGSFLLFLIDVHRRQINRRKNSNKDGGADETTAGNQNNASSPQVSNRRRSSLPEADLDETLTCTITANRRLSDLKRLELTCISEEGLADNILDELDFLAYADCMTSCDQVENYLMLSEYENNLNKTNEVNCNGLQQTVKRKRSLIQPPICPATVSEEDGDDDVPPAKIECSNCQKVTSSLTTTEIPVRKVSVILQNSLRKPSPGLKKTVSECKKDAINL
ncbi:hypothetical protein CHUAL_013854 [Chamberlinius hualienensis]